MTRYHARVFLPLAFAAISALAPSPLLAAGDANPVGGAKIGASHPDFSGFYAHVLDVKANPTPDSGLPSDPFVLPSPIGALPEGPAMNVRGESWQGDFHSPILRPWAAAWLKLVVEADTNGKPVIKPANTLCHPNGVLFGWGRVNGLQILDQPDAMYFLFHGDWTRVIHMNAKHPDTLKPAPYGHSIGHWEGDTLVVDTIATDGRSVIDRYQTPTSEALHIIERIRLRNGGKILQVNFWIEDPLTLTHPYTSVSTYVRSNRENAAAEAVCQEGLMAGHP